MPGYIGRGADQPEDTPMSQQTMPTATALARQLTDRTRTAEQLVRTLLDRIRMRDGQVQAWETVNESQALATARELDRGPLRGPLHGLPIGVKDIIDTAGLPTGYGSPIYRMHQPRVDAAVVSLARRAGAIVLGKTVTTEFATSAPARTRNPHNLGHTPGGSSSGSAAAVADGMVPLAFGTQTAGSVIRPAAFCGVVGFKPTHGLLPRAGVKATSDTLDTVGVLSRTVEDAAMLVAALSSDETLLGADESAAACRIGLCRTQQWPHARPETAAALEHAAALLQRAGHDIPEVALPESFGGLFDAQQAVMTYETARELFSEYADHGERLGPLLRARIEAGLSLPYRAYAAARRLANQCRWVASDNLAGCDVLLVPAAPGEAPAGLDSTGDPVMNRVWTLLHAPCVTLPILIGPGGLPVGIQVVGRPGWDAQAVAVARRLERLVGGPPHTLG